MHKKLALAASSLVVLGSLLVPSFASASSLTTSQVNAIISLLQAFNADSTTIANVRAALGGTTPSVNCVDLYSQTTLGSSGAEVTNIQNYLIAQGYLGAGYNTGYYGYLTAQAVGRLQLAKGIVSSSGDSSYGIMSPSTRAAIACSNIKADSLWITGVSGSRVSFSYAGVPSGTYVNALWKDENGATEVVGYQANYFSGSGTAVVDLSSDAPSGTYKLEAKSTSDSSFRFDTPTFSYLGGTTALNCTLTVSPGSVASGDTVKLTWKSLGASYAMWQQDGAANLLGLPAGRLLGDGSATFTVSGKSQNVTPTLLVYRDSGLSGSCSVTIGILPSVTIDQSSLSQNLNSISLQGNASGISQFVLEITGPQNTGGWVTVQNGRWHWPYSGAISLQNGTYSVTLRRDQAKGEVLATGTLVVSSSLATCPTDATAKRGQNGSVYACWCPISYSQGNVWGGGGSGTFAYYTDNSDICTAAAQSGQMSLTSGGQVDYTIEPGLNTYSGFTGYNITSQPFGSWPGSFAITGPKG
jgi:hypothetical protein